MKIMANFYAKLPFSLNDNEKVLESIKPVWKGYFLRNQLFGLVAIIFLGIFFAANIVILGSNIPKINTISVMILAIIAFIVIVLVGVMINALAAKISYKKFQIWITNQRIISARGFIGFNTESIAITTITDVVINRGFVDRILGLSSVMAVPMGGMLIYGRTSNFSTVGFIPALLPEDAIRIQKLIFNTKNAVK